MLGKAFHFTAKMSADSGVVQNDFLLVCVACYRIL